MTKSQVTTFYSYKGGSGRSMALSNVAWALATNGEKVLVIDWDLEAPGLNRYFHPFLRDPEQSSSRGLIDRVWDYVASVSGSNADRRSRFELANCEDLIQKLDLPVVNSGCLHFIGAGIQDNHYSEKVNGLDWASFYRRFDGETFINRIVEWARKHYTHILIDSRTGVADTAGICTTQLPDALVLCFVYNRQSIEGTASIARSIMDARKAYKKTTVRMEFVPSRVEERSAVEPARRYMAERLVSVIDGNLAKVDQTLRLAEIRNYPWCAFEEKLAVFEDLPDERGSLLEAMTDLAQRVSGLNRLKILPIDPGILGTYWQRAAFADPRVVDLRVLSGPSSSPDSWKQIQYWLESTIDSPVERSDWLIELAETAMSYATGRQSWLSPSTSEYFANAAIELGRRAEAQAPHSNQTRLAFLLHHMAGFLRRKDQLNQALEVIMEAEMRWRESPTPGLRWRCALTMERKAEILSGMGRHSDAVQTYREIIELYNFLGRRKLSIGGEFGPARIHRLLAQKLFDQGDAKDANLVISDAVKLLTKIPQTLRDRDASEAIDILIVRLRIAAEAEPEKIDRVGGQVMALAHTLIPSMAARDQVIGEFFVIQAEILTRQGRYDEALARIETIPHELQLRSRAFEIRAQLLLELERPHEAVELLSHVLTAGDLPVTAGVISVMQRAFKATGDEDRFYDILLKLLENKKLQGSADIGPLLQIFFKRARHSADDRVEVDISKIADLLPSLLGKRD